MRRVLLMLVWLATAGPSFAATTDGLFATFITSRGNFTAELHHESAPTTVANFVGLAEGSRAWLEESTGKLVQRSFYNGLTFHRVVPGFVIQAGSPNGLGTDGPGYTFGDEFHSSLEHNEAGILSMANSGADTNGSQFFITLDATDWLDKKHSVFGRVVEGMAVVYDIGNSASGSTTIERVEILRVGAAAQAFNASGAHGLPDWKNTSARWAENWKLAIEREPFTDHRFLGSENLQSWQYLGAVADTATPGTAPIDVSAVVAGRSKYFFRTAKILYARRPANFPGRTVNLHLASGNQTLQLAFSSQPVDGNMGTYKLDQNAVDLIPIYFVDHKLAATALHVGLAGTGDFTFRLKFKTESEGWFTGQVYGATDGYWPYFGTFQIAP
jgi:cyclophilin family peptidyl-prolyl cis-trans isomerase